MMNENDFKYVLQDFSSITLGARYSYHEIMENERVPFKLQSIVERYILPHITDPSMEIGRHVLSLTKEDPCYRIYENLKLRVKYFEPREKGGFQEKRAKLEGFLEVAGVWKEDYMLQEIIFSNLAVMAFHI
ncbi:MAG: hypothetical protein K2J95_06390 [Lachnospiraceae bacterium]|nr:hypothetical protein [Lachnospiraceae bacterium]MDE6743488.1 hypothetical protein [Lachnospiraceae bacterium]